MHTTVALEKGMVSTGLLVFAMLGKREKEKGGFGGRKVVVLVCAHLQGFFFFLYCALLFGVSRLARAGSRDTLVLCDGGTMDCAAYIDGRMLDVRRGRGGVYCYGMCG